MMKILFLHSGDRVPSARFRVLPYLPFFRRDGHRVTACASFPQKYDYFHWLGFRPSQFLKRIVRFVHLLRCRWGRYDVAFIDRELFDNDSWEWEEKFRKLVKVFVIDFDDAVFLRYPEKFERLLKLSDLVIAGNRFLEEKIQMSGVATIVIPTCVEMQAYPPKPAGNADGRTVIGWIGTTGNLNYLRLVAPVLRRLAKRCDFEFRIIAPDATPLREIDLSDVRVRFVTWRAEAEVEQLSQFDLGLMPLFAEDEWNKYKCGLKLIQYMAIGIPGVASPIGVNSDIVEHGVDGFLPRTEQEWEEVLFQLVQDGSLRKSIGRQAREKVQERYSIESQYPRLERALRETLKRIR